MVFLSIASMGDGLSWGIGGGLFVVLGFSSVFFSKIGVHRVSLFDVIYEKRIEPSRWLRVQSFYMLSFICFYFRFIICRPFWSSGLISSSLAALAFASSFLSFWM